MISAEASQTYRVSIALPRAASGDFHYIWIADADSLDEAEQMVASQPISEGTFDSLRDGYFVVAMRDSDLKNGSGAFVESVGAFSRVMREQDEEDNPSGDISFLVCTRYGLDGGHESVLGIPPLKNILSHLTIYDAGDIPLHRLYADRGSTPIMLLEMAIKVNERALVAVMCERIIGELDRHAPLLDDEEIRDSIHAIDAWTRQAPTAWSDHQPSDEEARRAVRDTHDGILALHKRVDKISRSGRKRSNKEEDELRVILCAATSAILLVNAVSNGEGVASACQVCADMLASLCRYTGIDDMTADIIRRRIKLPEVLFSWVESQVGEK